MDALSLQSIQRDQLFTLAAILGSKLIGEKCVKEMNWENNENTRSSTARTRQ